MIKQEDKFNYTLIPISASTNQFTESELTDIVNNSYLDKIENEQLGYFVKKDSSNIIKGIITLADAQQAYEAGYGFFRYTKNEERIFVYTRTGASVYINFAIWDYISDKEYFPVSFSYNDLFAIKIKEQEFDDVFIDNLQRYYLVSTKPVYSSFVDETMGNFFMNYNYIEFYSEPGVVHKYIINT